MAEQHHTRYIESRQWKWSLLLISILAAMLQPGPVAHADVFLEKFINRITLPQFTGKNDHISIRFTGRLFLDAWSISGGGKNPADIGRTIGIYKDGFEVRSFRLGATGKIWNQNWRYKIDLDYDSSDVQLADALIRYVGWDAATIIIGHQREPFGLEQQTGRNFTLLMERALPGVFSPGRALGLSVFRAGRNYTFAGGIFGPGFNDADSSDGSDPRAITARLTWAPLDNGQQVVHLGLSTTYRELHGGADNFRINTRPEIRVLPPSLLDTGDGEAQSISKSAFEFAWVHQQFSLQGEYLLTRVAYESEDIGSAKFSGFYIMGSWNLGGESRQYIQGKFQRVYPLKPLGSDGWGSLEAVLRVSKTDLNAASDVKTPLRGGVETNFSAGLNWYMTSHVRLMLNAVHFRVKGNEATRPLGFEDHKGWGFGTRFQIDW